MANRESGEGREELREIGHVLRAGGVDVSPKDEFGCRIPTLFVGCGF
jgi:hypothetical protein